MKDKNVRNAILIGTLCFFSYLGVYFARNIMSAVAPQIIEKGIFSEKFIGNISSGFFICYAIGQLFNGLIGDRIKSRYMMSFGLLLAGICTGIFPYVVHERVITYLMYALMGFFLAMIYAPMTKLIAENMSLIFATRTSLAYTFASYLGSPLAGILAILLTWQSTFAAGAVLLVIMGLVCYVTFLCMEKKNIIQYNSTQAPIGAKAGIRVLIERKIVKFTMISVITGVVRTTVVFWLPTYLLQYLGFSAERSAGIFTIATVAISATAFIAVFLYERLKRNMNLTLFIVFVSASVCFLLVYLVHASIWNIIFMVLAIMSSNCASSMLWSRYCPSLRDTGMVSSATGFLDFVSYMSASVSSTLFANAVDNLGWKNLILIWFGLMLFGVVITASDIRRKHIK